MCETCKWKSAFFYAVYTSWVKVSSIARWEREISLNCPEEKLVKFLFFALFAGDYRAKDVLVSALGASTSFLAQALRYLTAIIYAM